MIQHEPAYCPNEIHRQCYETYLCRQSQSQCYPQGLMPLPQMDARVHQDDHSGSGEPLPDQETHPAEEAAEIDLYSCLHYSVDIHS